MVVNAGKTQSQKMRFMGLVPLMPWVAVQVDPPTHPGDESFVVE
jgi:hypothetical protein